MRVYRPLRGGSWGFLPGSARASRRNRYGPSFRLEYDGFRCALIVWRRR